MPDYQKMYATLFNAITDVICVLQEAQQLTEEIYTTGKEPKIEILPKDNDAQTDD